MNITLPYIYNNSSFYTTGTLRLTFWATTSYPARGAGFTGYRLATFPNMLGLLPNNYYSNLNQNASMVPPPNGTYWLMLVLEEYDPAYCSSASGFCVVDSLISDSQRTFGTSTYTLSLFQSGSGSGGVFLSPAGTDCGLGCKIYNAGTVVSISPNPDAASVFDHWLGSCTGSGGCTLTMDANKSVTAFFNAVPVNADLSLTQTVNANPGSVGKDVVFTMTATNNGPATANGVVINAAYDATATVIWASPNCVRPGAPAIYACSVGSLTNGASAQVQLVLRKSAPGSTYNNAGTTSGTPDPNSANNIPTLAVTINPSPLGTPISRYRLYSPVTLEHHFTTDLNEYMVLGSYIGTWNQEGTVGKVFNNPASFNGVATMPYYRLYCTGTAWHHWTTDANEYYTLQLFPGWQGEGVDGHILPSFATSSKQLYRLLYPGVAGGLHHWTIDANEYTVLINQYGWIGEGGSGFVLP